MYVRTYVLLISLHTVWFNRFQWLQVPHDITVDLAAVSKLGVGCFFRNIRKGSWKIKGVMRKKKIKWSIYVFFLYLSLPQSYSVSLSIYASNSVSFTISLYSLFIYLSLSLYQKALKKITGPQSLLHIVGDRGPIKTNNLAVS